MILRKSHLALLSLLLAGGMVSAAEEPVNLSLQPGVKLSADCHYLAFTPDKAADGNREEKASRWLSLDEKGDHWLEVSFPKEQEVNYVTLHFWSDTYISVDFDIQVRSGDGWKTVREVRDNKLSICRYAFPTVKTSAVRVLFHRQIPDGMVRLYELGVYRQAHPTEVTPNEVLRIGVLSPQSTPQLQFRNCEPGRPAELSLQVELVDAQKGKVLKTFEQKVSFDDTATVNLPLPETYGSYEYRINLLDAPISVVYFPEAPGKYRSASPFGSHYHSSEDAFVRYAGIYWWRNHDVYGRWNNNYEADGSVNWSGYDERLEFVRRNQIRECSVYLGAPPAYSTILPGEPVTGPAHWTYSYYPPSNLEKWVSDYLIPMAERTKKASPFRAHEVWNEAWSYYRLRGLHGTAGEAAEIFRISYDALKKVDPEALVYSTDIKPEAQNNPYAFKDFGRDMFELGFLRYNDLLSYHSYGIMTYPRLERMRRNMWDFGRDFELWSTETAVEGKPAWMLMESLVAHRASGNGKTFIYSGGLWAPLMLEGRPTLYLVAQAALCRTLGDALPLGFFEENGVRVFVFANGGTPVAVLFTDSREPVKVELPLDPESKLEDMFGRTLDRAGAVLSQENPVIVIDPSDRLVRRAMAERIRFHAAELGGEGLDALANRIEKASDAGFARLLDSEIAALGKVRRSAVDDKLYTTGKALDFLTNAKILLARRAKKAEKAPMTLDEMRKAVAAQWKAICDRTGNNGVMLNTERLTSRAQKEMQQAAMYDNDGDAIARDLLLEAAAEDLANARSRTATDKIANLYRTKSYFRSQKRLIRSELYCFPNGRPQEAVITLANPFGRVLSGTLEITPPAGWKVNVSTLDYEVPAQSRSLLPIEVTAPKEFKKGEVVKLLVRDRNGNFPPIEATCEVLEKIPPYPVLGGSMSTGEFTGN